MDSTRLFERMGDLRKALARLRQALSAAENDLQRDAVIQRFEFTFEIAWKTAKAYLEFKGVDARSPKDTLREALSHGIIDDGNGWTQMIDKRNLTSHTYDEKLAVDVYAFVKAHGLGLFDALAQELSNRVGKPGP
jgi:nucleotidyltransferase substrate binding protein (TIGR01987 family)